VKTRVVEIGFFQTERSSPPSARTPSAARSRAATPNAHAMADPSPAKKARLSLGGVDTVVVLDYGSQYTQLITRRVRELGVYAVLLPGDVDMVRPRARGGASSAGRRSPLALVLLTVFFLVDSLPTRADPSSVADLSEDGAGPPPPRRTTSSPSPGGSRRRTIARCSRGASVARRAPRREAAAAAEKSLRIGVHHANAVVRGPV